MFRLVMLSTLVAASCAQVAPGKRQIYNGDPQVAAILQEQRYLSGDGTFGAAYQQEDGIDFKEESDANGNRKGSYSYVDPTGQRRTVTYTAGKDGFQATGDHLPAAPAPVTAPLPQYNPPLEYSPQQQYSPPQQRHYSVAASPEDDGQYHPELYDNENYVASQPQRSYNSIPQQEYRARYTAPVPASPPQPQYTQSIYPGTQQAQYSGIQAGPSPVHQPRFDASTPPPHRFFPPGKFNLNRSPDGFSYTFSKQ